MVGRKYKVSPSQKKAKAEASRKARAKYAKSKKATVARKAYVKRYGKPAKSVYKTSKGETVVIKTEQIGTAKREPVYKTTKTVLANNVFEPVKPTKVEPVFPEPQTYREQRAAQVKAQPPQYGPVPFQPAAQPTGMGPTQTTWGKMEAKVSKYTTKPLARGLAYVGVTKERVATFTTKTIGAGMVAGFRKRRGMDPLKGSAELIEFQKGLVTGAAKGFQEKPVKTAAVAAAFYAFPQLTAKLGLGAAYVAPASYIKYAPTVGKIGGVAGKALITHYGVSTVAQAYAIEDKKERGEFIGEKITTEVGPALVGGRVGGIKATGIREKATVIATVKTKLSPAQQKEFFSTLRLAKAAKPPKVYKAPFEQVLPKREAQVTREFLAGKGKKAVLYGSVAQKTQVARATKLKLRPSGDIDIAVKDPHHIAVEYATKIYQTTGTKPKIPMKALARGGVGGPAEEATVFVKGKAVTFHTMQSLKGSPFYIGKARKTPGGVYVQRIEEQLGRKVAGAMVRGRAKDIPDYKTIAKDVASQLRKQKPGRFRKEYAEARIRGIERISKLPPTVTPKDVSYYKPVKPVSVSPYYKPAKPYKPAVPYKYPVPTKKQAAYVAPSKPYKPAVPAPYVAPPYKPPTPYSPPAPYTPTPYKPPTPAPTYPAPYPPTPYTPPAPYPPTPYRPPTPPAFYPPTTKPGAAAPPIWPTQQRGRRKVKRVARQIFRSYRYTPNVAAVVRGTTGVRPKILTGVGTRPIVKKLKKLRL
tara:strand:+ start:1608 stop:3866 length:2259 start_codon:yes stop_codon:yes gene_type:complete